MLDVSLSGCRLRTLQPFAAGASESVKVTLSVHGMALTIWGDTQWTTWDQLVGIRFIHSTERSRNQLVGLLTCLLDQSATEVVMMAVAAESAQADSAMIALEQEPTAAETMEEEEFQEFFSAQPPPKRPELRSEHKVLSLDAGESPALLHLVAEGVSLAGNILDVSQDGCMVRLVRPVAVRQSAQAEVDFHLLGLNFRLPGVTREIHGEGMLEIRFTEMSKRKREDLSQVIMELILQNGAGNGHSG
jgi:hypothetical protein